MTETEDEKRAAYDAALRRIEPLLAPGAVITSTACLGTMREHYYTGRDGIWLCGIATDDTIAMGLGSGCGPDNDIAATNVTHINRRSIDYWEECGERPCAILRRGDGYLRFTVHSGSRLAVKPYKIVGVFESRDGTTLHFNGSRFKIADSFDQVMDAIRSDITSDDDRMPF